MFEISVMQWCETYDIIKRSRRFSHVNNDLISSKPHNISLHLFIAINLMSSMQKY